MKSKCARCRQADAPKTPFCEKCAAWLQSGKFLVPGQCQWCGTRVERASLTERVDVECEECERTQEDKERPAYTGDELIERHLRRVWSGKEPQ